jgi:phosphoglycolate phosphatase
MRSTVDVGQDGWVPVPALPDTVLLDLDGTLVDSAPGIFASLRAALAEEGVPWPAEGMDGRLLGPPLYVGLRPLLGDATERVVATYRRHYATDGLHRSTPYPGVIELLEALAAAGVRLAVATSKAQPYAETIVGAQGWTELFDTVCGDTLDRARPTKADVVGEALARLGGPGRTVMVGDRHHDVDGARAHGLPCRGAGWGYGPPGELAGAGAVAVHATPGELQAALLGHP